MLNTPRTVDAIRAELSRLREGEPARGSGKTFGDFAIEVYR